MKNDTNLKILIAILLVCSTVWNLFFIWRVEKTLGEMKDDLFMNAYMTSLLKEVVKDKCSSL